MSVNASFRQYVTRVSFALTLSRNQVSVLTDIVFRIEDFKAHGANRFVVDTPRDREIKARKAAGECVHDNFVMGARWLGERGLVKHTDPSTMTPKWSRFPYELTEAGEHVVALLRIAGLMPAAAANTNRKKKRRAA
jgi:hypothetical protein